MMGKSGGPGASPAQLKPVIERGLGPTARYASRCLFPLPRIFSEPATTPRIAIDILSPGQDADEEAPRCAWYVEQGTSLALLVDPYAREVRALVQGRGEATLRGSDRVPSSCTRIPGPELAVSDIAAVLEQETS